MKTAMFKRLTGVLSLVLVAVMLLTLVGCTGGNTEDPAQNEDVSTTTTTAATDAVMEDEGGEDTTSATKAESTTKAPQSTTKPSGSGGLRTTGGNQNSTTKASVTATKPSVAAGEDVLAAAKKANLKGEKIEMMLWWTAGKDDKAEAATFKKETGIEVTYKTVAMKKYQDTLAARIATGDSPELAAIINEWYPRPITTGLMQSIDKVSGWNFKDGDVYALSLMDQFSYKGKHYGIALKGSNMATFEVMFFNKQILKKSGVKEDPYTLWKKGQWNWDTCLAIAEKCTDQQAKRYGISNVGQYYWMLSAGEDFVKSTKAGLKNNIMSAGVLNAWNWNWKMIYDKKVVDTTYTGQTPFYQGKAAMLGGGSYLMQADSSHSNYVPQNMKADWGVVPFPSPKGKTVAGCEGTVWGFPTGVSGKKLQAAAWYLRYYLDDYHYSARDFYPKDECWEVMKWMWDQQIQSYNSVGVLTYKGEHTAYTIQFDLVDNADTKAKLNAGLEKWEGILENNINDIENAGVGA